MEHTFKAHLHSGETIQTAFTVSTRTRVFAVLAGGVVLLIIWIGLMYYAFGLFAQPLLAVFGTVAIALLFTYMLLYNLVYLPRAFAYVITDSRIIARRGLLNNIFISVSFDKITDIMLQQSVLDRFLFNAGTLHINTSGSAMVELTMPGIDDPVCVKQLITQHMHADKT